MTMSKPCQSARVPMYNKTGSHPSRTGNGVTGKSEGLTPFGMTVTSFRLGPSEAM